MVKEKRYDLIVAGGGLSGVAAAVAAARAGRSVLLIERYGFLGGMATAGLVNPFMPYTLWKGSWDYDWRTVINKGIFGLILSDLDALGGLVSDRQTFNEEALKLALDRMVKRSGVELSLHTYISGAQREGETLRRVSAVTKSGTRELAADYFIDASGDGDLAALAGCRFEVGRSGDAFCQPMTLCFRIGGIDFSRFDPNRDRDAVIEKYRAAKARSAFRNPRDDVEMYAHVGQGVLHFNSTRVVKLSAIDAEDLTEAELEGREQAWELFRFLKDEVGGFEGSYMLQTAPQIGVRESRRIAGEYVLSEGDMLSARKFPDSVARGSYPVDIHNPSGAGTTLKEIPYGDYYTIPYRATVPLGIGNLGIAGRCISATHEAHSAHRIMPICCNVGEAVGTAAAIASERREKMAEVDIEQLHARLDEAGALY